MLPRSVYYSMEQTLLMPEYTAPRGTRDILPGETAKWQYLEEKFREICALCGFKEIRTPTFEHTELFTRNLGETTDVVSKEMYTFHTKGSKSVTLRPEGTAPAIRAYVQHNLGANLPVNKLYYIARLFRYERPQAGRFREHTQLGIEAVGSSDPAIDAEVIGLAARFIESVGVSQFELKLNSIGCPNCRPDYRRALVEFAREQSRRPVPVLRRPLRAEPATYAGLQGPRMQQAARRRAENGGLSVRGLRGALREGARIREAAGNRVCAGSDSRARL